MLRALNKAGKISNKQFLNNSSINPLKHSKKFNDQKNNNNNNLLNYGEEVLDAKNNGKPIVALESTIITHGMPYPDNFYTALKVEDIIRNEVNNVSIFIYILKAIFIYLSSLLLLLFLLY